MTNWFKICLFEILNICLIFLSIKYFCLDYLCLKDCRSYSALWMNALMCFIVPIFFDHIDRFSFHSQLFFLSWMVIACHNAFYFWIVGNNYLRSTPDSMTFNVSERRFKLIFHWYSNAFLKFVSLTKKNVCIWRRVLYIQSNSFSWRYC